MYKRQDKDAVRVLKHFVSQNMRRYGGAVSQALVTLAKMSAPGVEQVFRELTWTKDSLTYSKAIRAYFAIPRHAGLAPEARRYLNSRVSFPEKKLFINQLTTEFNRMNFLFRVDEVLDLVPCA